MPKNLLNELLTSPKTFVELVCITFKAEGKHPLEENINSNENTAENAWKVLHYGRGTPGIMEGGDVDVAAFNQWVIEAREIGRKLDRETMTDQSIGQWMSNCPEQEEGIWPCYPVCELLEQFDASEIRKAFKAGVYNNRGVITKTYRSGGDLERNLATKYKGFAEKLNNIYPQTANLLNDIAQSYDYEAKMEDDDVRLSDELD
ncbi:hypothetical protein [Pseudoalteromonas denitrificans]|uniref:Uncharacterized protein n=1 Tax=Pseudoalteromonas denitrificans DSM 6059 TaxID=1123010 RepID=A0A1I1P6N4_9GAMM|nr:hypothetical protein [Pseudoalteromonas denitrificans]SFD05621.1 hypothetical protein SAMN02745724_03325 [Pseudoalteromonas denitrificans DSM 6059]